MFKLKSLSLSAIVLIFGLSSCSNDDSSPEQAPVQIEGKWQFTKEGKITNSQEVLNDYQHTSGCSKDYTEILAGNVIKDHYFDNPNCQETIDTGVWNKSNNSMTLVYPNGSAINAEIMELTNTTLKMKYVLSGDTKVVILTKI
ncbi:MULTISPECIES: lipocalin family protein [unclassified Flavobacterium]|uniref:lipocalin family protein n=1 Tax=unclassified Flavobacterium TaxID=196869 RepID=UPI00086DD7D5|nr:MULTISPECIES: lipocalin family protein [unclassified Flavobacterium]MBN9285629.1 lipocalin family protein [Flavobacterium sp.]ODS91938.1 MAG: hypothetical protein ABS44_00040 [Chryseobacterium sp. SCN 40-13]OJV71163.1 MAG: hypothetical protein BGO42_04165 [Flavobacterium sp. 40-81]